MPLQRIKCRKKQKKFRFILYLLLLFPFPFDTHIKAIVENVRTLIVFRFALGTIREWL